MANSRANDWRTRWLAEGFGLGPFAFGNEIESKLRKEISLEQFSQQLHEQLELQGLEHFLPSRTVSWLYEIALSARVEKETVILAQRRMTTKAWRSSERKMDKLIAILKAYPEFDPERMLGNTIGRERDSRTRRRAVRLLQDLRDIRYQFRWWSRFADWGAWRDSYKGYLVAMDNHLRKRFPKSLKKELGEMIEAVVNTSGLHPQASAESILKALRRAARERRNPGKVHRVTLRK